MTKRFILKLQKSTGGTHVYGSDVEGLPKSIYLPKALFPGPAPKELQFILSDKTVWPLPSDTNVETAGASMED